jgi:hypothetical protein
VESGECPRVSKKSITISAKRTSDERAARHFQVG